MDFPPPPFAPSLLLHFHALHAVHAPITEGMCYNESQLLWHQCGLVCVTIADGFPVHFKYFLKHLIYYPVAHNPICSVTREGRAQEHPFCGPLSFLLGGKRTSDRVGADIVDKLSGWWPSWTAYWTGKYLLCLDSYYVIHVQWSPLVRATDVRSKWM